ncbi:MAG: hypothetical protein B6D62_01535 [Candidatus Cloacimonas sp. 4484_275]|nr:MAG: hypothetical protein B6D62_01535 [Candidatus Cloacimonas sp. 4484_275]
MATNRPVEVRELFGELVPASGDAKWFVVYVKPNRAKKLAEYAFRNGIHYFLPLKDSIRVYGNRKIKFTKPLFPGYIFIKCNPKERQKLIISGHIVKFLNVDNENELLFSLKQINFGRERGVNFSAHKYIRKGMRVEIVSGALKGMKGFVEESEKLDKVILQVDILRQAVSVSVTPEQIKILEG